MAENSQEPSKWGYLISCIPTIQSIGINKDTLKVGRAQACDVILTESMLGNVANIVNTISKEHCVLHKTPGLQYAYLQDLSKNGTYINKKKIKKGEKVILNHLDKISMGCAMPFIFRFELSKEDLPDTQTPLSNLVITPKYTEDLPVWGRLVTYLLNLDSYDLRKDTFKIGRSYMCDLSIEETRLKKEQKSIFSKEHFVIHKDSDKNIACITDLSKAGTYLNNELIGKDKMQILQHDDVISIGTRLQGKVLQIFQYKCMYEHDSHFLPPRLKSLYEPATVLGKGGAGEVRLAYEKITCEMVAIKKITKGRSTSSQKFQLNHPSKIETEIKILLELSNLCHPSVIKMKNILETPQEVFIVLEYMRGGELTNRILTHEPLSESNVKFLFYQMVLAVNFLHNSGITHRDLKPENILLQSDEIETVVKVSDFGLSKVTNDDDMMRTMCGTISYIAPEIIDRRTAEYNRQVDVWSLGVILFYMLAKKRPFENSDRAVLEKTIISGKYSMDDPAWSKVTPYAKDLVKRMLTVNPERRINIFNILQHPWISRDFKMREKVDILYSAHTESEVVITYDMEPPLKRIRSSSDESSGSSSCSA